MYAQNGVYNDKTIIKIFMTNIRIKILKSFCVGFSVWGSLTVGRMPGVLLRVRLVCTRGVVQISFGWVGFVDVCGSGPARTGTCSVSPLKIFASASSAVVWRPG